MGRLSKWRAQQTVNLPSNYCDGSTPSLPTNGSIVQLGLGLRIVNPATWVQIPLEPPFNLNGVYFNLVEFMLWEHEVASSNLATPTNCGGSSVTGRGS